MIDKNTDPWKAHPIWVKWWFFFNYLSFRPFRKSTIRGMVFCHLVGFVLCACGYWDTRGLISGLWMLAMAHFFHLLLWQGDKYGIWYDHELTN